MTAGVIYSPRQKPVAEQVRAHAEGRTSDNRAFFRRRHKRYPFESDASSQRADRIHQRAPEVAP